MTARAIAQRVGPKSTLYIRGIPTDVKNAFHAWCIQRDLSMSQVIEQYMRDSVSGKPVPPPRTTARPKPASKVKKPVKKAVRRRVVAR